MVADTICCQMLCPHSLASLADAVNTISGEPIFLLRELQNRDQILDKDILAVVGQKARALLRCGTIRPQINAFPAFLYGKILTAEKRYRRWRRAS
jgi:hypothetical protein